MVKSKKQDLLLRTIKEKKIFQEKLIINNKKSKNKNLKIKLRNLRIKKRSPQ
jgi:hypothetical protein